MRFLVLFFFSISAALHAQVVTTDYILSAPKTSVPVVKKAVIKTPVFFVQMPFGSDSILNPLVIDSIKKYHIERIELVYSAYKSSKEFSQTILNERRLEALRKQYPLLFDNNVVKWQLIEQTGAKTADSARMLFHGFIVYPTSKKVFTKEKNPTWLSTEAEIKIIKEELSSPSSSAPVQLEPVRGYEGGGHDSSIAYRSSLLHCNFIDSIVLNYFNKNKLTYSPDKIIVVEDVTGSMYPYTAQTLMWRRAHANMIHNYIFFNDGDNKADNKKIIGKTGGIYYFNSSKGVNLEEEVYNVMRKGNGGDCAENNIEALLSIPGYCPDCEYVIMIADNYAPVKDISLVKDIKKPVHIILCGYAGTVQESYIRLAYETGGSIHTMNKTLVQFENLKEGDIVVVGSQRFKFTQRRFILVR